ncbi:MAG TPA: nickel-responsive transcriptional regulator NikR [Polyangiaceae bacterium]|nr:nickel-responsive transcriptional regulator NikR [Polyangiaceae bacterium]
MTDRLVRFGVAMESSLLEQFDQLVETRGGTRSEAFRDLARAAIVKHQVRRGVEAVATLTLIYDHHVRDLSERLTELQHDLGEKIRSTLHIHLDHDHCLEIIVMHGRSDELQAVADRILALKGVLHGALEVYAHSKQPSHHHEHEHHHEHGHGHGHGHGQARPHSHAVPAKPRAPAKKPAVPKKPAQTSKRKR